MTTTQSTTPTTTTRSPRDDGELEKDDEGAPWPCLPPANSPSSTVVQTHLHTTITTSHPLPPPYASSSPAYADTYVSSSLLSSSAQPSSRSAHAGIPTSAADSPSASPCAIGAGRRACPRFLRTFASSSSVCRSIILTCRSPREERESTSGRQTMCTVCVQIMMASTRCRSLSAFSPGSGFGNALQEILLNAHLAHVAGYAYVPRNRQ